MEKDQSKQRKVSSGIDSNIASVISSSFSIIKLKLSLLLYVEFLWLLIKGESSSEPKSKSYFSLNKPLPNSKKHGN